MTNPEIQAFLLQAEAVRAHLAAFQVLQADLLQAHPKSETQLSYDIQAIETASLFWQLVDVIREAKRELEARKFTDLKSPFDNSNGVG